MNLSDKRVRSNEFGVRRKFKTTSKTFFSHGYFELRTNLGYVGLDLEFGISSELGVLKDLFFYSEL
jgi:hypothetical protein